MSKKILVVDDQIVILTIIKKLLESAGFTVITTTDGTLVKQLLVKEKPDIIILDIMMPNKDGIENIRELREIDTAVIIVAVSSNRVYLDYAEKFGANYSYQKPIMGSDFIHLITSIT